MRSVLLVLGQGADRAREEEAPEGGRGGAVCCFYGEDGGAWAERSIEQQQQPDRCGQHRHRHPARVRTGAGFQVRKQDGRTEPTHSGIQ